MRWLVEVTSLGKTERDSLYVDADSWQKALQIARTLRGETEPMSGFSIELLEEGCRAVDPATRMSYEVHRAPDDGRPHARPSTAPAAKVTTASLVPAPQAAATATTENVPRPRSQFPPRPQISATATMMIGSPGPPSVAPAGSVGASAGAAVSASAAATTGGLPSQVTFKREQDATEALPLTYREYVYVVPTGSTEMAAATLVQTQLELVRTSLDRMPAGKLVNLAVFDVAFQGRPPVPPLATLAWKDWRGVALVSFPRQPGRAPITIPTGLPAVANAPAQPAPIPAVQAFIPAPLVANQASPAMGVSAPAYQAPVPTPVVQPSAPVPSYQPPAAPVFQPAPPPSYQPAVAPSYQPASGPSYQPVPAPSYQPAAAQPIPAVTNQVFSAPQPTFPPAQIFAPAPVPTFTESQAPAPARTFSSRAASPPAEVAGPPSVRVHGEDLIADLFESMHDLHFSRDAVEGGDFCLALAMTKLPSLAGIIELYDINRREFLVTSTRGEGTGQLLLRRFPENDSLLAAAMRKRRALVIGNAADSEAATNERYVAIGGARSLIVAPVMQSGRFLGAIELVNPTDGEPFTESDGNAVTYIAEQLAEFVAARGIVTDPERISARPHQ